MSLPTRIAPDAQHEYEAAARWYEAKSAGLGVRFVSDVQNVIIRIGAQPDRWPQIAPQVRLALVRGWPYCLIYEVHSDHVEFLAVQHTSRDPDLWQGRRAAE